MTKPRNNKQWFVNLRGSYIPRTREGWLSYIPFTLVLAAILVWAYQDVGQVYQDLGRDSGDYYVLVVSLVRVLPGFALAGLAMTYFAKKHS
jgi:hypothetical protein